VPHPRRALVLAARVGARKRRRTDHLKSAIVSETQPLGSTGLLRLFETSYINNAGAFAMDPVPSEGIIPLKYAYAREVLPAMAGVSTAGADTKTEAAHSLVVPPYWVVAMRLALVSFMGTAWFLSRSYTTTMYLVLGLATATIAIQGRPGKSRDRVHWIFSTAIIEVLLIVVIYGLVRFRH